ncbi:mas-related G-protein coupled receptor member X1-like [Erpetoichthys calabaricus]|uniref:mas-related G-protein coupled receptor member X1-like n=1 Tax=Erpetoichthys calabaricus TaxID=27687 RepID=UPI00109FFBB1|nr:mas-related G-protein coupled receptor member X1-like [Erpetoichthys calabaricus]
MENCNDTKNLESEYMSSEQFFKITVGFSVVTYLFSILLSTPLLFLILKTPSLRRKFRYILLVNLLVCDNLQLLLFTVHFSISAFQVGSSIIQCFISTTFSFGFCLVDIFFITALGIDRCIAIKWPLHYEAILSSGRKATLVFMIWGLSMALTIVALFLSVSSITCTFTVKRCLPILFSRCFLESDAYFGFKKILTAMLFLGSYTCIFLCFVILCWDIRIFLKTQRVWVTITLQGLQLIFYSVPVLMRYFLTQYIENKDGAELAIEALFDLGLSLIPLVYGCRSAELHILMSQLCYLLPLSKNQIQPHV